MKKNLIAAKLIILCLPVVLLLQGCFKDTCRNTYKIYTPVYQTLTEVRAEMLSQAPRAIENSGKIYVYGNYIFMNEIRKGIHVIDNTDPSNPVAVSFIKIPGNVDLAVKGSYLYADCYSDIVVFDISNPTNIAPVQFMDNVIEGIGFYSGNTSHPDSIRIVVDYVSRDTTVDCDTYMKWKDCGGCKLFDNAGGVFFLGSGPQAAGSPQGVGGSMARLSIVNNYMYGVSNSTLYAIDISNGANPQLTNTKVIGGGIETIYPFKENLFIGSTTGMYIYDISNPSDPIHQGQFNHIRSCDPVVTDGEFAYVTLRSNNSCTGFVNQLDVINVENVSNPYLVKTYQMTNPHGLSISGETLFVCEGEAGLKVYDASDVNNLQLKKTIEGIETFDVITINGLAIVVAKDGLYQYDYSNLSDIRLLSRIGK